MEILGLIFISCVLMTFKGGTAGVIMLWIFVLYKALETQRNQEKFNNAKDEFKKNNGYDYPGYWR